MSPELVRIVFNLDADAWHGNATERLWAERVADGRYRLRNSPFYAEGISAEDVVFGVDTADGLQFRGVSLHAGHSTYRLKLLRGSIGTEPFESQWKPLQDLGCSFEEGPVLAIDVPPRADIYSVYAALESGEQGGVWEFEEGHCGHPLNKM